MEAILCLDVLEHVEEPQQAAREMHRVLKKGGYCLVKIPFIFYYHPEKGYYQDFYRFTRDGLAYLMRDFSSIEMVGERGALATAMNLIPVFTKRTRFFEWIDRLFGKDASEQTSGFLCFAVK
ncbi:MAG TPA: methyltransferase domain-containing protein [Candidatus Paceibacterota bacterium]|nr:methyltransferase domain-containing protein [Candidatus Paceibacterota bacterium]